MSQAPKPDNAMVVELAEGVSVRTLILAMNHPALRSGFAGFPANPRWNATKFRAWKTGREWKAALSSGEMVVRSTDSMLVSASEQDNSQNNAQTSQRNRIPFRKWISASRKTV